MTHRKKYRQEKSGHDSEDARIGKEVNSSVVYDQKEEGAEDNDAIISALQNQVLLSAINMEASREAGEDDVDDEEEDEENDIDDEDDD